MAKTKRKRGGYRQAPQVPAPLEERMRWVLAAVVGEVSISEAARKLGLSRNQMQTLVHRAQESVLEEVTPSAGGRPRKSEREKQLEAENERLHRQNERLLQQAEMTQRLLGIVGDTLRGRVQPMARTKREKTKKAPKSKTQTEDPDGVLREAVAMRQRGLKASLAAALVGRSDRTLRRWVARRRLDEPARTKRRPGPAPRSTLASRREASLRVRQLAGLIGAEALSKCTEGLSRREAARVKRETLSAVERERRARATRVNVSVPGVVRGLDAMHLRTSAGRRYGLIAGDGAIPFRTSAHMVDRYETESVVRALQRDMALAGPPLVYRLDRHRSQRADAVRQLLHAEKVLVLHGPPHYPQFYGQLERQNREHRAWLALVGTVTPEQLNNECQRMIDALNREKPRRTLGWCTAQMRWESRAPLRVDRDALREEVHARGARLRVHLEDGPRKDDLATRLAIQQTLIAHGWLTLDTGGWC